MNDKKQSPQTTLQPEENIRIGAYLRRMRKAARISQEEAAAFLDVSRRTIYKYEMGLNEPPYSRMKKLCRLYHCSPNPPELENDADHKTVLVAIIHGDSLEDRIATAESMAHQMPLSDKAFHTETEIHFL